LLAILFLSLIANEILSRLPIWELLRRPQGMAAGPRLDITNAWMGEILQLIALGSGAWTEMT